MDEISFTDLDSFTMEMMQRVKAHKMYLDQVLNDLNDQNGSINIDQPSDNSTHPINSEKQNIEERITENESPSHDGLNCPFNNDEDQNQMENEIIDENYSIMQVNQVRKSINKLLNVHEPFINDDLASKTPINSRLHQRLNYLAEMYKDEHHFEPIRTQPVLKEQNMNYEQNLFKDRIKSIAQSYYPARKENYLENQKEKEIEYKSSKGHQLCINSKSYSNIQNDQFSSTINSKNDLLKSKSLTYEFSNVTHLSNVIDKSQVKKNSVADLKILFETKKIESINEVKDKEIAPELLPLREKRRLFEKAIRKENEARAKQYRKTVSMRVKWPPDNKSQKELELDHHTQPKRTKSHLEEQNYQDIEQNLSNVSDSVMDDKNNDHSEIKSNFNQKVPEQIEIIDEQAVCNSMERVLKTTDHKIFDEDDVNIDSMELTFSVIDNPENDNAILNSFYPELENDDSKESIRRTSTLVYLHESNVIDSDCLSPKKPLRSYVYKEIDKSKVRVENIPVQKEEYLSNDLPPLRTISLYRLEQKIRKDLTDEFFENEGSDCETPTARKVIHLRQKLSDQQPECLDRDQIRSLCQEKMEALKEEICEHNRVLSQASTALNLSLSMPDLRFSESRIEAERLLLISIEKRNACWNEINKLKSIIQNPDLKQTNGISKGTLYIANIKVPLLNEFLASRAKAKVLTSYYFICLIYNGPSVFISELLDTNSNLSSECLEFELGITINDLNENFNVTFKLFSLELSGKDGNCSKHYKLTPFKSIRRKLKNSSSGQEVSVFKPTHKDDLEKSIMSTNFKMIGYVPLTLNNVKTTTNKFYRLDSECFHSIIDNYLTMNVTLKVEHRNSFQGYFDMQEQGTTFWNLRWFSLRREMLMYWRFEEQEAKSPLGVINLKHCINPTVGFLKVNQRHICMRANTFVLVTIDPPAISNTQKLLKGGFIAKPKPKIYFISSQSKVESLEFCLQLNQILRSIRIWETDIVQPYSLEEFDRLLLNCHQH